MGSMQSCGTLVKLSKQQQESRGINRGTRQLVLVLAVQQNQGTSQLPHLHSQYGRIRSIDLKTPSRPPAFAFIEFGEQQSFPLPVGLEWKEVQRLESQSGPAHSAVCMWVPVLTPCLS